MQVAVAVGCRHTDGFSHDRHRGPCALLLEVVACLDGTLLLLERLLAAVYLSQLRHELDKGLGGAIDRRQQGLHLLMNFADVSEVGKGAVILLTVQLFLLLYQLDHILQDIIYRFLLGFNAFLQVFALSIQFLDGILNLLLAQLGRDGCLDVEPLVGMQADTASTCMRRCLRELVLGIAAVENDVASLGYDLRRVTDHVLTPVDAWIHGFLMDDGCTALDTTSFSDAL